MSEPKLWYPFTHELPAAVLEEASLAFKLNAGLFDLLELHLDDKNKEGFIEAYQPPAEEKLFSLASVAAVIAAGKSVSCSYFLVKLKNICISLSFPLYPRRQWFHWGQWIPETTCC